MQLGLECWRSVWPYGTLIRAGHFRSYHATGATLSEKIKGGRIHLQNISYDLGPYFLKLLNWFKGAKRDLPWRKHRNAYSVWVSEIMLQQTQAQTVIPYFQNFMERYPNLQSLAQANENELLKQWEGLGYYSRARNLLKTAKHVMQDYNGSFPRDFEALLALPGIGRYTAGALLSLALNVAQAAVDGNVLRVLARLLDQAWQSGNSKDKKAAEHIINQYFQSPEFGNYKQIAAEINESLIELGALVCSPKNPLCSSCPCTNLCLAKKNGTIAIRPLAKKSTKQSQSEYTVIILQNIDNSQVLVEKRAANGLLASLWQFPMLDGLRTATEVEVFLRDQGFEHFTVEALADKVHVFSHLRWHLAAFYVRFTANHHVSDEAEDGLAFAEKILPFEIQSGEYRWLEPPKLQDLPFSAALFDYRARVFS